MEISERQIFFMSRLVETIHQATSDEEYEKNKYYWNTIGKNILYNIAPGKGYDTGLITTSAYHSDKSEWTSEHVFSNVKMFNVLIDRYREDERVNLDYLKRNVKYIVPLITSTKHENNLLRGIVKDMSAVDVWNMEHYKKLNIKLKWNRRVKKINANVTNAMKELIVH